MKLLFIILLLYSCCLLVNTEDIRSLLRIWSPSKINYSKFNQNEVSEQCLNDMIYYKTSLINGDKWANSMLDSSGRSSSRFLFGSNYWLGSRVQCNEIDHDTIKTTNTTSLRTIYKIVNLNVNLTSTLTPQVRKISLGLCIPSSCNALGDVEKLVENSIENTYESPRDIQIFKIRSLPGSYSFIADPGFILLMIAVSILFIITITGTLLDKFGKRTCCLCDTTSASSSSSTGSECNGNHLTYTTDVNEKCPAPIVREVVPWSWKDVLIAFSLYRNIQRFFSYTDDKQEGSLTAIHGIRVFSFTWVIACHTCLYAFAFSDNKLFRSTVEKDFLFQSISNGNFSVDSFFFVSGLLVTYVFIRAQQMQVNNIAAKISDTKKFFLFFLYRYIRLTPPYLFVIAIVSISMQHFASESVFDPPTWDHLTCKYVWWRNILYINTLFPVQQMCMIWSWYLAADTQFYVVGVLLLFLFVRRPRIAVAIGIILLFASWITTAIITYSYDHQPSIEKPFDMFDALYDKPWTRFGPYLIGMSSGWLLAQTGGNIKLTKVGVAVGWTLCMSTSFGLVHALYGRLLGAFGSAAYVALSHTFWAVTVGWVLIACTSGHGGWVNKILSCKLLIPFSRGTYCAYLIHAAIIQWCFFNMDGPLILSRDFVIMLIMGFTLTSYFLGIVISILLEAPCTNILGLFHPLKKKASAVNKCPCHENKP